MDTVKKNRSTGIEQLVRFALLVLMVWVGYVIINANIKPIQSGVFEMIKFVKYLFFSVLFVITIVVDGIFFSKNKRLLHLLPTLIGLIFLVLITRQLISINIVENKPELFHVRTPVGEEPFLEIEFKKDGVFKFIENSMIGLTHVFGEYEMKDSIIRVLDFDFPGYSLPEEWSFKGDTLYMGVTKLIISEE